jgi:hypothetical protein
MSIPDVQSDEIRRTIRNLSVLLAGCVICSVPIAPVSPKPAGGAVLRPAMLVWKVGRNTSESSGLVETITRTTWRGREVWRVAHYPQDPVSSASIDLYELDLRSLAPLHSFSSFESTKLELTFLKDSVEISGSNPQATLSEHVQLNGPVQPEGPGLTPFVATLPLRVGYQKTYRVIDRWSGQGNSRSKEVLLVVVRETKARSPIGVVRALELRIRAVDDSFEIRDVVLAEGLHWPLRIEYKRNNLTLNSEVISIATSSIEH